MQNDGSWKDTAMATRSDDGRGRPARKASARALLLVCAAALCVLSSRAANAAIIVGGGSSEKGGGTPYVLEEGEVVQEDLVVFAGRVDIRGRVAGDLIAVAGEVHVDGIVDGDLLAVAGRVTINGAVGDDARIAAGEVGLSGSVADDMFVAGGDLAVEESGVVGQDLFVAAGSVRVAGRVRRDLRVGAGNVDLSGQVGRNANLGCGDLTVREDAHIAGTLGYSCTDVLDLPPGVASSVDHTPRADQRRTHSLALSTVLWVAWTLLIAAGFVIMGSLVHMIAPSLIYRPAECIAETPGRAGLTGLLVALVFTAIPLASCLLLAIALLFGLHTPVFLAMFLAGVLVLLFTWSPLITGMWVGRRLLRLGPAEPATLKALLLGVIVIALLGRIPIVGWIAYFVSFLFALGGIALALRRRLAPRPDVVVGPGPGL